MKKINNSNIIKFRKSKKQAEFEVVMVRIRKDVKERLENQAIKFNKGVD